MKNLTKHTVVRYIIGGGTSACVNLVTLYFFNSIIGIYYLTASVLAFLVAFCVSWAFHKFWTFKDHSTDNMHKQGALYLMTSLFGLLLNTILLYISVEWVHAPVIVGQIIAGGLVACCTFFISKHFVFKARKKVESTEDVLQTYL